MEGGTAGPIVGEAATGEADGGAVAAAAGVVGVAKRPGEALAALLMGVVLAGAAAAAPWDPAWAAAAAAAACWAWATAAAFSMSGVVNI